MFRYATSVYGEEVLLGASWSLIWWFVAAGAAVIVVHAVMMLLFAARPRRSGP